MSRKSSVRFMKKFYTVVNYSIPQRAYRSTVVYAASYVDAFIRFTRACGNEVVLVKEG